LDEFEPVGQSLAFQGQMVHFLPNGFGGMAGQFLNRGEAVGFFEQFIDFGAGTSHGGAVAFFQHVKVVFGFRIRTLRTACRRGCSWGAKSDEEVEDWCVWIAVRPHGGFEAFRSVP
jgi:hypothetical protein